MNLSAAFNSLSAVRSPDADTRRRGANLVILGLGMAALALTFGIITALQGEELGNSALLLGVALFFLGAAALGRAGRVNAGAWLLIGVAILGTLNFLDDSATAYANASFLSLAVLLAGVLLPPMQIWAVLALCAVGINMVFFFGAVTAPSLTQMVSPLLLLSMVALIGFVSARGINVALREAQAARREAEAAGEALAATNAALERRVEERTAALRQAAEEQEVAAAELRASLQAQQDLNRIVAELSVPVIPVSAGTLIVPLVGNIDSARADQILSSVLDRVEGAGARTVVLDVTGVAVVDTHVAGALLRVARATYLMGAQTVLAGIRPEVAQALVGLGVDLSDLRTVATLQEAL